MLQVNGGTGAHLFLFKALADTGYAEQVVIRFFSAGMDRVGLAGPGLTFETRVFAGANQIRRGAALSMLQIDEDGNVTVDRQVELTDTLAFFDPAADLLPQAAVCRRLAPLTAF